MFCPLAQRTMVFALAAGVLVQGSSANAALHASLSQVTLRSPEAVQQLLVWIDAADDLTHDVSRQAVYKVADPGIASVDADGLVRARADGRTEIIIRHGQKQLRVPLEVTGFQQTPPLSFRRQIVPILGKAGCNSAGCHGKAEGNNGFKLSTFGFDPDTDYEALVQQSRGRRIGLAAPRQSLLLRKATAAIPHGGGRRFDQDHIFYCRMRRWISEGARLDDGSGAVQHIEVQPQQQVLLAGQAQQLQVTAVDVQGNRWCVTVEAEYKSNAAPIATVNSRGLIQASETPGEAAILVRYLDHVGVARITLPRPNVNVNRPPEVNFIDRLVWDKLQRLGIHPSGLADDATFLRRVYLDVIGTLPTPQEARQFLDETRTGKRARLIGQLLNRNEYADYWAMRWADILRVDQLRIDPQGAVAMTRWLRRQFANNRPYDELVREIITAKGNRYREGPASFYKAFDKADAMSRSISQLFLGVRIECAQCHHHPSEKWGQEDYYALAGFFTGVTRKSVPGGGEAILSWGGEDLKHPRTGQTVPARVLGAAAASFSGVSDRRTVLADWITSKENPYFARSIANRLWAHYFGRGLVEPIDDLRATNPATNEPLLEALAVHLQELDYDLKALTRTLLNSRVYQLSTRTNPTNASDQQNFSHAISKALPAEVLLDAVCQATGVPEHFNGWPVGYRSIQVWDSAMPSYFFRIFGRPVRASVCECERSNSPSIAQALHLMNSPEILGKIHSRHGMVRRLVHSELSFADVIEELFLATLSRRPSEEERSLMLDAFTDAGDDRRAAAEDVLWAMLNSKYFIYNH